MGKFNRGIEPEFIDQLREEARKASWWADVLNDPKLLIAVREQSLNVYWRGQSLFRAKPGPKVTTHVKFLLEPELDYQIPLVEGEFKTGGVRERAILRHYEGPKTLKKMKEASGLFSGLEKAGCHEIGVNNPQVIDCEISFGGTVSSEDSGGKKGAPRADLASLERGKEEDVRLVFWEAKHYSNSDLRAEKGRSVPVCDQVRKYQKYLSYTDNRNAVVNSYTRVAENLVAIREMGLRRTLSPLIVEVGTGKSSLTLDPDPKVGLIIFGFDQAEKDDPGWGRHLARLKSEIGTVVAVGDPKKMRLRL